MDIFLFILSITFMIVGIIGSIVPVLPGPLSSWLGLFIFSNIEGVEVNNSIIVLTLIIAITIFALKKDKTNAELAPQEISAICWAEAR